MNKKELIRIIKFTFFSISAGVIQLGSFTLMNELTKMPYWSVYLISLVLSVLWNFTLNRKFTFSNANNVTIAMIKVSIYYAIFTPITTIGGHYIVNNFKVNEYIVEIGTMFLNLVTEFLVQRYFVYGKVLKEKSE